MHMLKFTFSAIFFHRTPVRRWISAPLARGKAPRILETTLPCHASSQPPSVSESSQFCVNAGTDPIVTWSAVGSAAPHRLGCTSWRTVTLPRFGPSPSPGVHPIRSASRQGLTWPAEQEGSIQSGVAVRASLCHRTPGLLPPAARHALRHPQLQPRTPEILPYRNRGIHSRPHPPNRKNTLSYAKSI